MNRALLTVAAVLGFTGVAFGALGAHALKGLVLGLPDAAERLAWWTTGANYHLVHALAVGLVAVLAAHVPGRLPFVGAACLVAGVALFSGSLYALALTGQRSIGRVTPFGGVAFLTGWVVMAFAARKRPGG